MIQGQLHTHDITFLPQSLTPPERIARHEDWTGFVHLNYVICTYDISKIATAAWRT